MGANLTITRAPFPGDGEEPGDGTVPQGGESKFDTTSVYDGQGHTIDTNALLSAFAALVGGGCEVSYAVDEAGVQTDALQWAPSAPAYTNVGEYAVWYRVTTENYEDFVHKAKVTITPRPVNVVADAQSKRRGENDPPLTYTSEALIAGNSFSGSLEREPGETNGVYAITIGTLTAGGNYEIAFTGASFTIVDDVPQLPGVTIKWKFASGVGRYFAQIVIPAYAGYAEALGNLAFIFADRKSADGTLYAQLWNATSRAPCNVMVSDSGIAYRGVALETSAFAGKDGGTPVCFGVSNATLADSRKVVPANERKIGLYVRKRVSPVSGNETDAEVENFIGYLTWTTGGVRYFLPVVEGAPTGAVTQRSRSALAAAATSPAGRFSVSRHAYSPKVLGLSSALGLHAESVAGKSPTARITQFEICDDGAVRGRIEAIASDEASSSFGTGATLRILSSGKLGASWSEEASADILPATGAFELSSGADAPGGRFFKAVIETREIFE